MFSTSTDPDLQAARVNLGRLYAERVAASFGHDRQRQEIEEAFPPGKDRDEALAAEDERFLRERDAIQKKIDALSPARRAA